VPSGDDFIIGGFGTDILLGGGGTDQVLTCERQIAI
jgi:Ca2+-binding RTX toxin-like protein